MERLKRPLLTPDDGISNPKKIKSEDSVALEPDILQYIDDKNTLGSKKHIKAEVEPSEPNIFPPVLESDLQSVPSTLAIPLTWASIYNEVVKMRSKFLAPVDTMGCERIPEEINHNISEANPRIFRFQLLLSLMLSSQTKDEVNFQAMCKLQAGLVSKGYQEGISLESVSGLTEEEIDQFIQKVGFHKKKAAYIGKTCTLLRDEFEGDVPKTIENIVKLPGVGPKMGYLLLQRGWNINDGIGVDVHLHRLSQMWGWASKSNKPEQTRAELEAWLPRKFWSDINPLLVGFGQIVCVPKAPNCDICSLAKLSLCKGANKKLSNTRISEARILKLQKGRSDLSNLITEIEDLA